MFKKIYIYYLVINLIYSKYWPGPMAAFRNFSK